MRRIAWFGAAAAIAAATIWLIAQVQPPRSGPDSLMPDGALLYLEAKDFHVLLNDWNSSQEKRMWLAGDDYAAFSRSRLFGRLSQAQDEFSTAASLPADASLLAAVAGGQSALVLYDIGNLQFVYVTRMDEARAEATPLWQVRDKFELRTEGAAHFFVREDQQSNRTAAFAFHKGWMILGTRADLVAGVLDRLDGQATHGLADEPWYANAVQQAARAPGDLRMVLNLEKIVPSRYFRSYWVQRNITEMKQYRAALCDLNRGGQEYREDRVLLRSPGSPARASGDVGPLLALAPENAVFASAQASPDADDVLAALRDDVLDPQAQHAATETSAPPAAQIENAGSASDLEQRIDVAPEIAKQADPYAALRSLLESANPMSMLTVYRTDTWPKQMFVGIERGMVVQAGSAWNEAGLRDALSATLRRGVTASQLGIGWTRRPGLGGEISVLDGSIPLALAIRGDRLYIATSDVLLSAMLSRAASSGAAQNQGVTYEAEFQHSDREQQIFQKIAGRLNAASHGSPASYGGDTDGTGGEAPAFFSGNVASLSRTWSRMIREQVSEKDEGAVVSQTVVYEWKQP